MAATQPWDRQPNEPAKWFARFEKFRIAGPSRSIEAVFRGERKGGPGQEKKATRHWSAASQKWRWKERAEAWDDWHRRKFRDLHERTLEEAHLAHAQAGRKLLDRGLAALEALQPLEALLRPKEIVAYIRAGIFAERQALQDQAIQQLEQRLEELAKRLGIEPGREADPA